MRMSAELVLASANNASLQATTVGGSKPLHRFIKGQPKIIGIVVLVLGSSFFCIAFAAMTDSSYPVRNVIPPGIFLGALFNICGILYILTEHNPTKKTVTISLALTVVALLGIGWAILSIAPNIAHSHYYRHYHISDMDEESFTESEEVWSSYYEAMGISLEAIFLFYSAVGAIIFIVMSTLAGTALRSTKSQAIVVMTTAATETPVD